MSGDDTEPNDTGGSTRPLRTDLRPVVDAVREADAAAFVAVGDRFDDDLRYLTRFFGPDRPYALVVVPRSGATDGNGRESDESTADQPAGRAVLCAPALFREQAEREFVASARERTGDRPAAGDDARFHDGVVREVRTKNFGDHAGKHAAVVADDLAGSGRWKPTEAADRTVLTPASVPHDAAVYLGRAGNALASTDAVAAARARKTPAEVERLRRVQRAAVAGMARAESALAEINTIFNLPLIFKNIKI
ncbi:MAG: M24 family metallopeptidase, partial [Methanobacteriota archaeon]